MMLWIWTMAALVASGYCIARGIVDLRQGKYLSGIVGIASVAILLLILVLTHAVKVDLPIPANR